MKLVNLLRREPVRAHLYAISTAVIGLLVVYRVLDSNEAMLWGSVAAVLLSVTVTENVRRMVVPVDDGSDEPVWPESDLEGWPATTTDVSNKFYVGQRVMRNPADGYTTVFGTVVAKKRAKYSVQWDGETWIGAYDESQLIGPESDPPVKFHKEDSPMRLAEGRFFHVGDRVSRYPDMSSGSVVEVVTGGYMVRWDNHHGIWGPYSEDRLVSGDTKGITFGEKP